MPGTIVFKPLQANLKTSPHTQGDPYCTFTIGNQRVESHTCNKDKKALQWNDSIALQVKNQPVCFVEVKNQEKSHNFIGNFEVDLREVESNGNVKKWFTIFNDEKPTGEILMEASFTSDTFPSEESLKAAQGNVPVGIDYERYLQDRFRLGLEPENSLGKISETNEFGDYQPIKQLPHSDLLHEKGSGKIEQGQYYSGQQTSYGEAYPMVHKSVAVNQATFEDYGVVPRGDNPTDYARFQNQAFVPHFNPLEGTTNPTSVEKAFDSARDEENKKRMTLNTSAIPRGHAEYTHDPNAFVDKDKKTEENYMKKTDTSGPAVWDVIESEKDISKGVGQPTPHTHDNDADTDKKDFRDLKNTKQPV